MEPKARQLFLTKLVTQGFSIDDQGGTLFLRPRGAESEAELVIQEVATDLYEEIVPELRAGFKKLEAEYAFRLGSTAPIVYTGIADSGVMLTLRNLCLVRKRRSTTDRISAMILDRFAEQPTIEFAYPTYRAFRLGEDGEALPPPPGN